MDDEKNKAYQAKQWIFPSPPPDYGGDFYMGTGDASNDSDNVNEQRVNTQVNDVSGQMVIGFC